MEGPAFLTWLPLSSTMARTWPMIDPVTRVSPVRSVPRWTRTVATGPRFLSSLASMTVPLACLSGLALQVEDVGRQQDHFQQLVDALAGLGRNRNHDGRAAPLFRNQFMGGQFLLDLVDIGAFLVDLVDGDHDLGVGSLGVVDGLDRLRHDAVIGRDDQDGDIGDLGAAGAHGRERFVAGRIEEGDLAVLGLDRVGADVLGDAAGFAGSDRCRTDAVQNRGLAVVDMAHDDDDRRTRLEIALIVLGSRRRGFPLR